MDLEDIKKIYLPALRKAIKEPIQLKIGSNGHTTLYIFASRGDLDSVRYLVEERSVALDVRCTVDNILPIHIALLNKHEAVVRYLKSKGARTNLASGNNCKTVDEIAKQEKVSHWLQ